MADGSKCEVDELVILSIKIQDFAWRVQFAVIENCPVPAILGMEFFYPGQACVLILVTGCIRSLLSLRLNFRLLDQRGWEKTFHVGESGS
jgi:hypothetical protein